MTASLGNVLAQLQRWASPSLDELSDAALLERFIHGRDESAFAALVARHGGMVLRSCRRVLGDAHEAEDAFQAVFLILARKAHTLRQPAALPGYLHSVARRVALKAPLARLTARELLTVLDEEVARLPTAQRSAVVLCCLEGYTREEAARLLGCPLGSVKGHLERGRKLLQARLRRRGLALAAVLALVTVSRGEAVPALLRQDAIQAALHGGIGSSAAALAQGVLQTMFLSKLATVTAVVLTIALAAASTIAWFYRHPAAETPENKKPALAVAPKNAGASKPSVRTDASGGPLPEGAMARLGTVRFRHGSRITFAAFTPDGKRLVSRGADGVRVWDASTGKELRHFALDTGSNRRPLDFSVDLSPDGKQVAAVAPAPAGAIQFWDVDSGKKTGSFGTKFRPLVRYSPDGKLLAVSAAPSDVELWDLAGQKKLRSWKASEVGVEFIAFSADARKLLTVGSAGAIRLWDTANSRRLQEFKPPDPKRPTRSPPPMALSPDGNLFALIQENEKNVARISLYDSATGKKLRLLTCSAHEIVPGAFLPFLAVTFTPDGKRLVTGGPDHLVRIWDVGTGEVLRLLPLDCGPAASLVLSKDGKKLAATVAFGANAVRVLDRASGKASRSTDGHFIAVQHAALTADGRMAVTGDPFGALFVWDAATGRIRHRLDTHEGRLVWLQLGKEERTLFTIGWDKVLRVWDIATGQERRRMAVTSDPFHPAAALSHDGKTLAVLDAAQTIHVLDAANGGERKQFRWPNEIMGMKLTADGCLLTLWSYDRKVCIWDVRAGRRLHEYSLPQAGNQGYVAAVSPDGRLLAAMGVCSPLPQEQPMLIFLDLATGQIVRRIRSPLHTGVLAFSPDGRTLAWTSATDTAIRLLEVASGGERDRLTGHRGSITTLAFSADGRRLISGCSDTTALIWDLRVNSPPVSLNDAVMDALWHDLASTDAARAYRAIQKLAASSSLAIPFMRDRLRPLAAVDAKRLVRLLADLDSDAFATREKATVELANLGEQALSAYRKALQSKPSLESRRRLDDLLEKAHSAYWDVCGERLRVLRAIEALELAGTPAARDVLKALAAGADGARRTEEAKAALQRLANRKRDGSP